MKKKINRSSTEWLLMSLNMISMNKNDSKIVVILSMTKQAQKQKHRETKKRRYNSTRI